MDMQVVIWPRSIPPKEGVSLPNRPFDRSPEKPFPLVTARSDKNELLSSKNLLKYEILIPVFSNTIFAIRWIW
jgi:hypothetical protein